MGRPRKSPIKDRVFYVSRKPGRFSPKSRMVFPKAGPSFSTLTPQQRKVKEAGIACGHEIRGKYTGPGGVKQRRAAMGACIRSKFGYH